MILTGSQRGGARQLAAHLLSHDNDHVTVHEVKGFATSDLTGAFVEAHAISKATKCRQFLFSLSLSPPPEETVSTETFENAIQDIEEKLDLTGQPRAIVFHEKNGRRHAHVVWSRIDADTMKAKQMSFFKMKLRDVSKDLFLEHGWKMPEGLADSQNRDPRNFTLQDWLQASAPHRHFVVGYRAGEILSLTVGQVQHLNAGDRLEIKQSKSKKYRAITINKTVERAIHAWLAAHPKPNEKSAPLFISQRTGRALTVSTVNNMIKRWCADIKLSGNYGSHSMRKTWGYHQRVYNNQPIPLLMVAFGHTTQAQTLDYLCVQDDEIRDLYGMEL